MLHVYVIRPAQPVNAPEKLYLTAKNIPGLYFYSPGCLTMNTVYNFTLNKNAAFWLVNRQRAYSSVL